MNSLRIGLIGIVVFTACVDAASKSERRISVDSPAATTLENKSTKPEPTNAAAASSSVPVLTEPAIEFRDPPDSSTYGWRFPTINEGNERFIGSHVRHPSGLMVIWFDTATRATEDTDAGTTHVDSVVVSGLRRGEYLSYYCNADGRKETWKTEIVGILRDTTNYLRPRMAWQLDTVSYRIRAIPTDRVLCSAADIFGEGDGDDG